MSKINTIVFQLLIMTGFLTPAYSLAQVIGQTTELDLKRDALVECRAEKDRIEKAIRCAQSRSRELGQSAPTKELNQINYKREFKQTEDGMYECSVRISGHEQKLADAAIADILGSRNNDFYDLYIQCVENGGDFARSERQNDEDRRERQDFQRSCDEANREFVKAYREYKNKCSKAGIGDCDNNIGACLEAVGSFRESDEFAYNVFNNARMTPGSTESACPSLTAENFKEMKEAYKEMKEDGKDEQRELQDLEKDIQRTQAESLQKLSKWRPS
ncbi:MAG: hypothetical protein R2827_01010 [Bdellovibrionales bacterium]